MEPLAGRRALITGATSGIGAETARALSRAGAHVIVIGRRRSRLDAIVDDLPATGGAHASSIPLDVTSEADCQNAVDVAAERLGGLDLIVNNAGVMLIGPIDGGNTADWRQMIDTNLLGTMYITRAALPHLRQAGGVSDIVNMSSVAGRIAYAGSAAYNATKFAINGFSEGLRQELTGTGIRISVVEPGMVATELTDRITDPVGKAQADAYYGSMPILGARDVADAVLYITAQPTHGAVNEILLRPSRQQAP